MIFQSSGIVGEKDSEERSIQTKLREGGSPAYGSRKGDQEGLQKRGSSVQNAAVHSRIYW